MQQRFTLFYLLLLFPFALHAQAPVEFIQNKGQWGEGFYYKALTGNGDVFLSQNSFTYLIGEHSNNDRIDAFHHGQIRTPPVLKYHVYRMTFKGANEAAITGAKPQTTYYNYFLGNDSSKWKSGIHPFLSIDYKGLYQGIDMHVSSEAGNIVYDFMVQPQAEVGKIRLNYSGTDGLSIKKGNLIISTSIGDVMEMKPYAYQLVNEERKEVACKYAVKDSTVTFSFPDDYDHSKLLVIDPTIVFCTFSGSTADNWGFTATYDAAGNFYAGGLAQGGPTFGGGTYPVSTGAFQATFNNGNTTDGSQYPCDIAIMKFDPTGASRIYATYIGGSSNEQPHSMIVDGSNNLIIVGRTYSSNYPVTPGAYRTTKYTSPLGGGSNADIIVTKLNATGTSLIASTYMGGTGDDVVNFNAVEITYGNLKHNYGDDARSEVQMDKAGNIYVAACTKSTDFPTANAFQTGLRGTQDGVVFKMNSTLSTLLWSTYIGGANDDAAYVLAFDSSQASLYVAGGTQSTTFPATAGTYHATFQGGSADGWIAKFQNSGTYPLQAATFVGAAGYDQIYGLQTDPQNNVYAIGQTLGGTFPVSAGVYSNPNSSQFVIKLDGNLTANLKSTVFGSGNSTLTNISPVAFLVDTCENIYISGWGGDLTGWFGGGLHGSATPTPGVGSTHGMPYTPNATDTITDGSDFYFFVLSKNMVNLIYATFFGRKSANLGKGEHVDGGTSRFDKNGVIYQAICGGCAGDASTTVTTAFPTTAGSWSPLNGYPANCNEAALKIAFNLGTVSALASVGTPPTGCAPITVTFNNTSVNALSYYWDFGDHTTSSATAPTHTYTTSGTDTVLLVAYNANACSKTTDTFRLVLNIGKTINAAFTYKLVDSCGPYVVSYTNTSTGATAHTIYTWDLGDGTTYTGTTPPTHTYGGAGSFTVVLTMTDTSSCNKTDTAQRSFTFSNIVTTAGFTVTDTTCQGQLVTFNNTSVNDSTTQWSFGDGQTSTDHTPTHTYTAPGTYTIKLVVRYPGACRGVDSITKKITVKPGIVPDFTIKLVDSCGPYVASFINTSTGVTGSTVYTWELGDGTTYTGPTPPAHTYVGTGTYSVVLVMSDPAACNSPDSIMHSFTFTNLQSTSNFSAADTVCQGATVTFKNQSVNGDSYEWYFGDGDTSIATSPTYIFTTPGTYSVILVTHSTGACNGNDTFKRSITVVVGPTANFSFSPPVTNAPIDFTNLSTNAVSYLWDFGDGKTSTDVSPSHLYQKTDHFTVCLQAFNNQGCQSKLCKSVATDILPLADIPTGFSPNGDGENDVLYVRGHDISVMDLKIYNRWGQLIFESTKQEIGWDGTYNGKPQEMEAYAYVLKVLFGDGTTLEKKGNVTLLR